MKNKFLISSFSAGLLAVSSITAFAQENQGEGEAAAPATRTQTPQEITANVHGAWQIRCVTTEPRQCFLYQLIVNEQDRPLLEMTLIPAKDETGEDVKMVANIVTPLGVLLGRGLITQVDSKDPVQRQFSWCAPQGCYSRFPVNGTQLSELQGGTNMLASIFMVQNPNQDIEITLPLDGFKPAYEELMEIEEKNKS